MNRETSSKLSSKPSSDAQLAVVDHSSDLPSTLQAIPSSPSSVGPICSLPPEILVEIFQACSDLDDSPWRLACVCVRWREIAIQTPSLWRYICLFYGDIRSIWSVKQWSIPGVSGTFLTAGRKQVYATVKGLDQAILRSGSTPLDIDLSFTQRGDVESAAHQLLAQNLLLRIFAQKDTYSRISRLTITQLSSDPPAIPIPNPLPNLKAFEWIELGSGCTPFIRQLISGCGKLSSIDVSFGVLFAVQDFEIWRHVKCFYVKDSSEDSFPSEAMALNTVIPECLSLEEFKVMGFEAWPGKTTPPITCRHLHTLELYCEAKYLQRIDAPLLGYLELYEPWSISPRESKDICMEFPELATLIVRTNDSGWIFRSKLPKLKSLTVTLGSGAVLVSRVETKVTTWEDIFPPSVFPTVESAIFQAVGHDNLFIAALQSVPNAESITVIPDAVPDPGFGSQLVQRLSSTSPTSICGKASRIQFGNRWCNFGVQRASREPLFRGLVAVRQGWITPLQSLQVYWTEDRGPTEYLTHTQTLSA
ncbi:hypothetical protein FRB91_001823 [Serendipita sp. 411]|nr:hypothetical protein FRC15_000902 [Serendipita sp. 397]KAG8786286.1 hypothetical protein FRC16_001759 [Serendipita sp. 398]KAG8845400.1 hypothetical protein FRB91_001823 [Serendipita sp. 411]KAG8847495.1 hypothetical protein FRC20_002748 [Serendipita sp. 405]